MAVVAQELRRLMPAVKSVDPEEAITGRWNMPEEEAEQEEPLPESPSRLRALFYDTILELSEHIADNGKAPDGMLEVTANIKRVRDEVSSVGARVELTENRFEDIRREQRERESSLRYAIIDLTLARNDLDEKGGDKRRWDDLQFQLKQLESNLAVLEQQRSERFTLLNTELGQQRDLQRSLEHELVAHYRRLYNEVDALRGMVDSDESRKLYRALDRCRAAIAKSQPRPTSRISS
jgi:chromosome segregation ATPase